MKEIYLDRIKNRMNDTSWWPPLHALSCVCKDGNEDMFNEGDGAKTEVVIAVTEDSTVNINIDPDEEMADCVDDIVGSGNARSL